MNKAGIAQLDVTTLPEYKELLKDYNRQMYMILGEAAVFGITLILGIYFINRAFARELTAAEKQKNFLLSITHELKSPLASINLILSTFIKRNLPAEKVNELSQDGLKECVRLEDLFNKILIATRLDKAFPFNFEETDLSNTVYQVVQSFKKSHADVLLNIDIQDNIIKAVDRESMVSVVKNLLENAYKYSSAEKQIGVSLKQVDGKIYLVVADNGVGIAKNERVKIFEQFYRIGSEETRESKGTGLGLYIVNKIVKAHNGQIGIESNTGGGTKFIITL
ncbi:MAG: HAMP domain-containing sensor histidine kinase [Saprospiraceae bacterium]|nr:HAMP domain-containing sensor histidine kinase [Saprospiraceae bacterium]